MEGVVLSTQSPFRGLQGMPELRYLEMGLEGCFMGSHEPGGLGEVVGSMPHLRELHLYMPFNSLRDLGGLVTEHLPRLAGSLTPCGWRFTCRAPPSLCNLDMANNHALDQTACEQVAAMVPLLPRLTALWVNFSGCSSSLFGLPFRVKGTPLSQPGDRCGPLSKDRCRGMYPFCPVADKGTVQAMTGLSSVCLMHCVSCVMYVLRTHRTSHMHGL